MADDTSSTKQAMLPESCPEILAILCFASDGNTFQGRPIQQNGRQFGLMGKKTDPPKTPYHQCCFEEEPAFYAITVIDYAKNTEHILKHVMKTNGDNCTLTCQGLEFHTDELYVGNKAESMIRMYFSDKLQNRDCYVCTGGMEIQGELRRKLLEEEDESDSDF